MVEEYDNKMLDARQKTIEFIEEMQITVEKFKKQLEEFIVIKNKIADEIKEEVNKLVKENDKTQNLFNNNKKEFNLMKDRFTQLSEFIKDIRFRINLGHDIKKSEFNQISEKIDFSKKQKIFNDKNETLYDNKYPNNEYEIKNGLGSEEPKDIIENKIIMKNYENTSKDYSHENIAITDKNNKLTLEKINKNDLNTKKIFKRRNTTRIKPFNFEILKRKEKRYSTINKDKETNKQNEISPKISPNKNLNNANTEGRNKLYMRKSMINEEMKNDSKRYSRFQNSTSPKSRIFNGLTNRDNLNLKNYSSIQGKVKPNLEENKKLTIPQSKLISTADNKKSETIKTNSNIYFMKKTTVKNLVRIQSAISPNKYPDILNQIPKSNSLILSSLNNNKNNKSSLEEDKNTKNKKKNKLINTEQTYVYFSYNKNKRNYNLRSYLSPNVKILQHSIEKYDNNSETKNLVEMVDTLQKYIKGQNYYYMNKKEKEEKNSEHFKFKEIFKGNNNNKNYQNDKAIVSNNVFKEKK